MAEGRKEGRVAFFFFSDSGSPIIRLKKMWGPLGLSEKELLEHLSMPQLYLTVLQLGPPTHKLGCDGCQ